MFKKYIQKKLEMRVREYFVRHPEVKLIVVVGSAGKLSTKRAIADILSQKYRVRMHEGAAYEPAISMLLGILGIKYPSKANSILQWLKVLKAAEKRALQPTDADVVIQELYTEKPGDMARFARFMVPDMAVVAAVTPEHMNAFGTIEAVAKEELSISAFAKLTLINRDDIEARFAEFINTPGFTTYGTSALAEYHFEINDQTPGVGYVGKVVAPEFSEPFTTTLHVVGEHSIRPVMAAVAAAAKFGMTPEEITRGMEAVRPVPGRMNVLRGIDDTSIIDDTYNSSPLTAQAAIQALYTFSHCPTRIAVLADLTDLGEASQAEHEKLGHMCDPSLLEWVVVVGSQAAQYLAPAARARGCQVKVCRDAIEAGMFVRSVSEPGAAILVKGPKKGFYMEETVKVLCNMTEDVSLVRQSADWIALKAAFFERFKSA